MLILKYIFLSRFREKVGIKVVKALKRGDDGVTHAAVDMLAALMQVCMHSFLSLILDV